MRILILGGDGYLGWPTAMHFSVRGHDVVVVDNYLRRRLCREENVEPLFNVPNLHVRSNLWESIAGHKIKVIIGDLTEWEFIKYVFQTGTPESVIHYAEQPSAPYSMLNRRAAIHTLKNNLSATANVIFAVRDFCPNAHVVKLGTMGEYGTPNIDIEEGWLTVNHNNRSQNFLYPRQAGSLYHTTKIMDTDLLWFYVRVWNLRVTDLMQGPVYGLFTDESGEDERLLPFFNYDEIFGTVINRFVVQAVAGYPLTVYGKGGQTRGYINIKDTLKCINLSITNPSDPGELRIFNQFTETFTVNELSDRVKNAAKNLGLDVKIQRLKNPRKEAEEHYYNPVNRGLKDLGLEPNYLTDDVLSKMMEFVIKHKKDIDKEKIFRNIRWNK